MGIGGGIYFYFNTFDFLPTKHTRSPFRVIRMFRGHKVESAEVEL